ncbi:MAG: hypothetical protein N2B05_02515, partial [Gemmatimonadales bacterium]
MNEPNGPEANVDRQNEVVPTGVPLPWGSGQGGDSPEAPRRTASGEPGGSVMQEIKVRVHRQLLERLNLSNIDALDKAQVVEEIRKVVHDLLAREETPLNYDEREDLVTQILDEIFGLGPIEPLLQDPTISDILVNTHRRVFIERNGRIEKTEVRFKDDRHLLQIIDRIVSAV